MSADNEFTENLAPSTSKSNKGQEEIEVDRYIVEQGSSNDFFGLKNFSRDSSEESEALNISTQLSEHKKQLNDFQKKSKGELEEKGMELQQTKDIFVKLEKKFIEAREQWRIDEQRLNSEIHKQMDRLDTLERVNRESSPSSMTLDSISSRFGDELQQHRSDIENLLQSLDTNRHSDNEESYKYQIKALSSCCSEEESEPFMKIDYLKEIGISREEFEDMKSLLGKMEKNLLDKSNECENLKEIIDNLKEEIEAQRKESVEEIQRLKQQIFSKEEECEELCGLLQDSRESFKSVQMELEKLKNEKASTKFIEKEGKEDSVQIDSLEKQNVQTSTSSLLLKCDSCDENYKALGENIEEFSNIRSEITELIRTSSNVTSPTNEIKPGAQSLLQEKDKLENTDYSFAKFHIALKRELEELRNSYSELQKFIVEKEESPIEEKPLAPFLTTSTIQSTSTTTAIPNEEEDLVLFKKKLEEQNNILMDEISCLAKEKQMLEESLNLKERDLGKLEQHLGQLIGTLNQKNNDVEDLVSNVNKLQEFMGKRVEDLSQSIVVKDEEISGVMSQFDEYFRTTQERTQILERELEEKRKEVEDTLRQVHYTSVERDEFLNELKEKICLLQRKEMKEREYEEMVQKHHELQSSLSEKEELIHSLELQLQSPTSLTPTTSAISSAYNVHPIDANAPIKPILEEDEKSESEKERITFLEKKIDMLQAKIQEIEGSEIKCFEQSLILKTLAKQLELDSFKYQKELQELSSPTGGTRNALEGQVLHLVEKLNLKDNNCKELTNEINRLLEERDALQLKLSSVLKQNIRLNESKDSSSKDVPSYEEELKSKLTELEHLNITLTLDLQKERESRRIVQEQLLLSQSSRSNNIKSKMLENQSMKESPSSSPQHKQSPTRHPTVEII